MKHDEAEASSAEKWKMKYLKSMLKLLLSERKFPFLDLDDCKLPINGGDYHPFKLSSS